MTDEHGVAAVETSGGGVSYAPKRGWTEEHRERFKRTMRRKKRLAAEALAAVKNGREEAAFLHDTQTEDLPHVLVCPRCGLNMRNVALAIAFSDKQ